MRFHPDPTRFVDSRGTSRVAHGKNIGASRFQQSIHPDVFYAVFTYQEVTLAVYVPNYHFLVMELLGKFRGLQLGQLDLYRVARREHRKSQDRHVVARWNQAQRGYDLMIPRQRFVATTIPVTTRANESELSEPAYHFARELVDVVPDYPLEVTVHPSIGRLWRRPQHVTVFADDDHLDLAVRDVGLKLYERLNWSPLTFELVMR